MDFLSLILSFLFGIGVGYFTTYLRKNIKPLYILIMGLCFVIIIGMTITTITSPQSPDSYTTIYSTPDSWISFIATFVGYFVGSSLYRKK